MTTAKPVRKTATPANPKARATPAKAPAKKQTGTSAKPTNGQAKSQAAHPGTIQTAPVQVGTSKADKKKDKPEKVKVLRDSFTIPKTEFAHIAELKKRAMALGHEVKKSELIRAGLLLLAVQKDVALLKALTAVPALKTGRPGKA